VNIDYQTPKKLKVGVLLEAMADTAPIGIGKAEVIEQIEDHMVRPSGDERETAWAQSLRRTVLEECGARCAQEWSCSMLSSPSWVKAI
jgi:hypothetical protein